MRLRAAAWLVVEGAERADHFVRTCTSDCFHLRWAVWQEDRAKVGEEGHRGNSVRVVLSHRVALVPTAAQEVLLRQAVGVSRFAFNWALAEWQRQYQAGERPSEGALRRQLNSVKRQQFPWMRLGRGRLWRWCYRQREPASRNQESTMSYMGMD